MSSPEEILTAIETELDNLEQTLLPLLTKPWSETLQALKEPLDRAKLNVCVGFGVVDLIWSEYCAGGYFDRFLIH